MERTDNKIKNLVAQMTLEEKAKMCVGKDFWHTQGCERLGIPSVMITDGPHGLRRQEGAGDELALGNSEKAVCFPAGCAMASSFDPKLSETVGSELGKLAQKLEVATVLGPAMNIKRSPLCGRNFEYYSEDPLVSSEIAKSMIKGIQSENVGACPKHFAANNQEFYRMTSNSVVDEQTMREIYLASFEDAVKEAKPLSIMSSYNKINGVYASENKEYLTDILRGEWGFEGEVVTDWGACNDPVESIRAGMDLCMPGPGPDNVRQIKEAVENGTLEEALVDRAVERVLRMVFAYEEHRGAEADYDFEHGHEIARKVSEESSILLKNEDQILPLKEEEKVLFVGKFVKEPRYQGGGSSHINPYKITSVWEEVKHLPSVSYAQGYGEEPDEARLEEAVQAAAKAEKVVIFAGLTDSFESEGYDRTNLNIPAHQEELIREITKVQKNVVVVLHNGSPVAMPWVESVKGILEVYLGGEAVGSATANLLYGKANPSGRLAETFPYAIEDTPVYPYYGVEKDDVPYREGVLVGYRYYETVKKKVLFPFGYGLSYTEFAYSNLRLDKESMKDSEELKVSVDVTNTGSVEGKEVVQVYVAGGRKDKVRPARQLRAFQKVSLMPGETKTVEFTLGKRAFAEWNAQIHDWYVPDGVYEIQIGRSVTEIVAEETVNVSSTTLLKPHFTINSPMGDMLQHPVAAPVLKKAMAELMGKERASRMESTEADESGALNSQAMQASMMATPMRSMISFSPDAKKDQIEKLIQKINDAVANA